LEYINKVLWSYGPLFFLMKILVTGSAGFVGKHLMEALGRRPGVETVGYDLGTPDAVLEQGLQTADVIFHLAGINRPQKVEEFQQGNADFTAYICDRILQLRLPPTALPVFEPAKHRLTETRVPQSSGTIVPWSHGLMVPHHHASPNHLPVMVLSSSIQAELDSPYGRSKRQAENAVEDYALKCGEAAEGGGQQAVIFRLKNIFGKWCRPNYNSVTATFCHNIAHDLPITISDPTRELELVYIDDVISAFLAVLDGIKSESANLKAEIRDHGPRTTECFSYREVARSFKTTLGDLAARILSFRQSRQNLLLPAMDDELTRNLYATYLSYLDGLDFAYALDQKVDPRGSLAEFLKSPGSGQIFVSRTKPGVTRGNHYHHSKTEKFLVVEGEAIIRFRSVQPPSVSSPSSVVLVIEHRVSGHEFKVVDIPPGYAHSIENVGTGEMVCLFWASEIFDPQKPDTYFVPVLPAET